MDRNLANDKFLKFHELYERHAPDVYRYAYWLSGDPQDADDLTSETFVRAWTSRSEIRQETVKAYLFTIARNLYLKQLRLHRRQVDLDETYHDPHPGPERSIDTQLELAQVQKFLQSLPEVDRTAFLLRVQHELPYEEVARILSVSISSAKVKVHRVRLKLAAERSPGDWMP